MIYFLCSLAAALAFNPVNPYFNTIGMMIGINLPMVGS
jgi:hypothetical protein